MIRVIVAGLCLSVAAIAYAGDYLEMPQSSKIKSWGYQLQDLNVEQAASAPYDLLVTDYSIDGTDRRALTRQQIRRLRFKPDGSRRKVLAYLSIGEAENYRYYWSKTWAASPPVWLGQQNKRWPGNFLVRFWNEDWQEIIFAEESGYLAKIIALGFDGVFLDRVDAYAEWRQTNSRAKADMITFVKKLSELAKARKGDFAVFVQNAEELLTDPQYRKHIDGVAKEDLLYGYAHDARLNPKTMREAHIKHLKFAQRDQLPVLVVEYLSHDAVKSKSAVSEIRKLGFVPYIAERSLSSLHPLQD